MAIYAISFRIGDEEDRSERYNSLVAKVKELSLTYDFDETTSFYIISSAADSASTLASYLYLGSSLNHLYDKLLVISLSDRSYKAFGKIEYEPLLDGLMEKR